MSQTVTLRSFPTALPGGVKLSSLLALLKKLQQLALPLATADGLRQAIQVLVQFGAAAGLNSAWLSQLQSLLGDSGAFNTVLSIIAYLESLSSANSEASNAGLTINAQSFANWLPLVIQILQLIESIGGNA